MLTILVLTHPALVWATDSFTIEANPTSATVAQGFSTSYTITVGSSSGLPVTFGVTGLPSGATAAFNPPSGQPPIGGTTSSTLTVTLPRGVGTPLGSYQLNVTASDSSGMHWVIVTLNVVILGGDFAISVSPNSLTVNRSESRTVIVKVRAIGGRRWGLALNVTGLPAHVTGTFTPPSVWLEEFTYLMTISVGADAINGTYPLTIFGTEVNATYWRSTPFTLIILPTIASPNPVQAAKKMNFSQEWSGWGYYCVPLSCQQSSSLEYMAGAVRDANDQSPVAGAVISIQTNLTLSSDMHYKNPYGNATITYTNITATSYTNTTGQFQFALPVPFSPNSTAFCTGTEWFPHYVMTLVANKAGYEPARSPLLEFPGIWSMDLSMEASASDLIIAQGQSGFMRLTIDDYFWHQRDQPVGLTAINLPEGVTVQFNPSSDARRRTINVTTYVSYDSPVGNHTITIQTLPEDGHRICIQLIIPAARTETGAIIPFAPMWVIALICVGAAIVLVAIAVILRSRGRHD